MQLSIIIPTKDRKDIFELTLKNAVNAIKNLDAEIIVINDSKETKINISKEYPNVKIFDNFKTGVASARNLGFHKSQGELLIFLDDDILISNETVLHILNLHNKFENFCVNPNWEYPPELKYKLESSPFGRFLKSKKLTSFKEWYNDNTWKDNELFKSKSIASFHLSISRKNFEKVGGYNENFPFSGFEDYDFPIRLKRNGIECYIDSRITVYHNEIDKINLKTWLNAQENRAKTRRVAVEEGYTELKLNYTFSKNIILYICQYLLPFFYILYSIIPNSKKFDFFRFKLISLMLAIKIYNGYNFK
ncbi:MAG TPA: glycosyltransferase [Bacteroidia bacterium]|nr:glycosyltransferase [Bacteroidia bacterium]